MWSSRSVEVNYSRQSTTAPVQQNSTTEFSSISRQSSHETLDEESLESDEEGYQEMTRTPVLEKKQWKEEQKKLIEADKKLKEAEKKKLKEAEKEAERKNREDEKERKNREKKREEEKQEKNKYPIKRVNSQLQKRYIQ
jgi:chromatin assembly factor 1 subunit A